ESVNPSALRYGSIARAWWTVTDRSAGLLRAKFCCSVRATGARVLPLTVDHRTTPTRDRRGFEQSNAGSVLWLGSGSKGRNPCAMISSAYRIRRRLMRHAVPRMFGPDSRHPDRSRPLFL